jgi:hypothetical protein
MALCLLAATDTDTSSLPWSDFVGLQFSTFAGDQKEHDVRFSRVYFCVKKT